MPQRDPPWATHVLDDASLHWGVGRSILDDFVLGHDAAAVLIELVQNEYDAGGRKVEVDFGAHSLAIVGSGTPIDSEGWNRLRLMFALDPEDAPKRNGLGSKNCGLRSLFLFGDRINISSGGSWSLLDRAKGTPAQPHADPSSRGRPGILIEVPFRMDQSGRLDAFTVERERQVVEKLQTDLAPTLIKLAVPGARKGIDEVVIRSKRTGTELRWVQTVHRVSSPAQGLQVMKRSVRTRIVNGDGPEETVTIEETEFRRAAAVPAEFSEQRLPDYFRARGGTVWLGVSVGTRRGRVRDTPEPALFFYPFGVRGEPTGNSVNVSAPFEMDANRRRLTDSSNSPWNGWLLGQAAELTLDLLASDWAKRFGAGAYRALSTKGSPTAYSAAVVEGLRSRACWPTRMTTSGRRARRTFAVASDLVLPERRELDGFLNPDQYVFELLAREPAVLNLLADAGAKSFGIDSLVRLSLDFAPPRVMSLAA